MLPDSLEHTYFCTKRPEQDAPRIEGYTLPRYDPTGIVQVGTVSCMRCVECGATSYDGVQAKG